jgi:hypothetical protein
VESKERIYAQQAPRGGIRLNVEAVANVKVASREPAIHAAVERLLGKTNEEIQALAQVILETNLRGVLATLTPEQVNSDCQPTSKTAPLPTPKSEPPPTRSGASFPDWFRLGCAGGASACSCFSWLVALVVVFH